MQATLKRENFWLIVLLIFVSISLFFILKPKEDLEVRLFNLGQKYKGEGKNKEALDEFEKVSSYQPDTKIGLGAARVGADLAYYAAKDYKRAVFFYRQIVRYSQNPQEVKNAQKKIAEIFYEKQSQYSQAIIEYSRLLQMNPELEDEQEYKIKIAKSYYYGANFDQALLEAEEFEKKYSKSVRVFDVLTIKANAYMGKKRIEDAIKTYERQIQLFPKNEHVADAFLNKSLAYEEKRDWDNAIKALDAVKNNYPHPEVLEVRKKNILRRKEKKKET